MLATPAILLLLVGLLAYGAWWGLQRIADPLPGNEPTPCVTSAVKELKTSQVAVRVFNGGYTTGLGAKVGSALTSKGFVVLATGNTDESVSKTVIVAASEDSPEAKLVQGFFKDSTIKADDRIDATVDVMVGSKYAGMNKKAKESVAVEGGTTCLAVLPSSSSSSPSASADK